MEQRWVRAEEAAAFLSVSRAQVYKLAKRPGFPVQYVGTSPRFDLGALDEWVRQQAERQAPARPAAPYVPERAKPAPRRSAQRRRVSVAHLLD